MSSVKHVLVTGGAGFIGRAVCKLLCEAGVLVTVLDSFSPQVHRELASAKNQISFVHRILEGDVRDKRAWEEALEGVDSVIHLAAETGTGQSMYEINRYVDVNLSGTSILLDILANSSSRRVCRLVVASSRSIYGEGKYFCDRHGFFYPAPRSEWHLRNRQFEVFCSFCGSAAHAVATDEGSAQSPASVYAITKQGQESLCMVSGGALGLSVTALRFQNVFGPGQSLDNPYTGILSIFSSRILQGRNISIFEDGLESRDFVYIDDVARSIVASIFSTEVGGMAINIGSGVPTSVLSVVDELQKSFGVDVDWAVTGAFRSGDIRHNFADISRARELLNWAPVFSFSEGIRNFVDWVQSQDVVNDGYEKSLAELRSRGLYSQ